MSVDTLISTSITSPLLPLSDGVITDEKGACDVRVFCIIAGYSGPASLTMYHVDEKKVYTAYTNEYGSVGFQVAGIIPDGEKEKSYLIRIATPVEEQRGSLRINFA